jgi:hypothetical protein
MTDRAASHPGPAAMHAQGLARAVDGRVRQSLASVRPAPGHLALDRLRVRLPAGATEADIADAIGRAVAEAVSGRRR